MKKTLLALFFLLLCTFVYAASLTISVKLPGGKPAKNVTVQMVQLENPEPFSKPAGKTDGKGNLKITFEDSAVSRSSNGHGVYRFVVMPVSFKWEVSGYFCWAGSANEPAFMTANALNTGAPVTAVEEGKTAVWQVTLSKGKDARIRVINPDGKPVKACKLGVGLDLHARNRTGLGAGITVTITAVDSSGSFILKNAVEMPYTLVMNGCGYYLPGMEYEVNYVEMPLKYGLNEITFKSPERKKITIRVRDFDTKEPLSGALVCEERRAKPVDRGGCFGKTSSGGLFYADDYNPEHVSKFGVTMEGYNEEWLDGDSLTDGGNYEFELKKKE